MCYVCVYGLQVAVFAGDYYSLQSPRYLALGEPRPAHAEVPERLGREHGRGGPDLLLIATAGLPYRKHG